MKAMSPKDVYKRQIRAYENGTTPNPCIDCNRFIKFEKLIRRAEELDFDCVVTGLSLIHICSECAKADFDTC